MNTAIYTSNPQNYLVACILCDNKNAFITNFEQWKKLQNFESLDFESFKLIPLLYEKLIKYNVFDENKERYKGVYKKCWVNNEQLFATLSPVFNKIWQSNISFYVIKDIAFSKLYCSNKISTIYSCDICIDINDFNSIVELLFQHDFSFINKNTTKFNALKHYPLIKQFGFINKNSQRIIIHLRPFDLIRKISVEKSLFNNSYTYKENDIIFSTLSYSNQLFFFLVNGFCEGYTSQLYWIIEVDSILKKKDVLINWDEFIQTSKMFDSVKIILNTMLYLNKNYNIEFPEKIIQELQNVKIAKEELKEFCDVLRKNKFYKLGFNEYRKLKNTKGYEFNDGYFEYVKHVLRIESIYYLPLIGIKRMWNSLFYR